MCTADIHMISPLCLCIHCLLQTESAAEMGGVYYKILDKNKTVLLSQAVYNGNKAFLFFECFSCSICQVHCI